MEAITAENQPSLSLVQDVERGGGGEEEEEEPHRLSFSNLPTPQTISGSSTSSAHPNHLFEFSAAHPAAAARIYHNDIVFCGKIIHEEDDEEEDEELNEYQKRDYFATVKSKSLRKPSSPESDLRRLSASTRLSGELARPRSSAAAADLDYHVQRVNISSLTSMSAKSRRRMFMFGPVKFKPEMELGAIKQRQAKIAEKAAEGGGGGGWKGQWGMWKSSMRGRSHLTSVLARSLGCIPVAGGGVERRLGAAV